MLNLRGALWAGTHVSLELATQLDALILAKMAAGPFPEATAEDTQSHLLTKIGPVGVISINGPLINADSPMLRYFGLTGYPEIRAAAVEAAQDPALRQILLNIGSPGGAVSGCSDTADLLARIDKGLKPVTAFASGDMASAAYWLAASARNIYVSKTSISGSIGVITVHTEATKMRANDGLSDTVMRAGKYKALGHPLEKFTDAAKANIQARLDAAYAVFVDFCAASRGVSAADADKSFAQGREFFGAEAVAAGLADGMSTFDAVVGGLSKKN